MTTDEHIPIWLALGRQLLDDRGMPAAFLPEYTYGVVRTFSGLGDLLVGAAFCRALARQVGQPVLHITGHGARDSQAMPLLWAALDGCPGIGAHVLFNHCWPRWYLGELARQVPVLYQVEYGVVRYVNGQPQALSPAVLEMNHDFPYHTESVRRFGMDIFSWLSLCSGVDVTARDLYCNAVDADVLAERLGSRPLPPRYVTLHTSCCNESHAKLPAPAFWDDLVAALDAAGIAVAQTGHRTDRLVPRASDCRGWRIAESAALIRGAQLHIAPEGGTVYVAASQGTRSVVLFGPTPRSYFSIPGNINLSMEQCEGCFCRDPNWHRGCRRGHSVCLNLPPVEAVADIVIGLCSEFPPQEDVTDGQETKESSKLAPSCA